MFMVAWEGVPPADKAEWIEAIQPVFAGAAGTFQVRFLPGPSGWRFAVQCRDDFRAQGLDVVANSNETIRFNLFQALRERTKPVDPDWRSTPSGLDPSWT